jgi:MFS family permease
MTSKVALLRKNAFYGWISLAGASLTAIVGGGIFFYAYGVFLPVMCAYFNWSRAALALGLSLGLLTFGLLSPVYGVLVDRFGSRASLMAGNLLLAMALAGMSLVKEVWHVYLFYSLAGIGGGLGGYIPVVTIANNWFKKKRPLAMGITAAATGVGGFIFPPLATMLISSLRWQMSWLVLAGVALILASLVGGLIMVRNRPEDMGQSPDGISAEPSTPAGMTDHPSPADEGTGGWLTGQALRQPVTWLITIIGMCNLLTLGTLVGHQVAHVQDLGFSPTTASLTLSTVSVFSIIGSLVFGPLALRFNLRYLASAAFVLQLIALIILLTTRQLPLIYIYAVLWGSGSGILLTVVPTMIGEYYGRTYFAKITGVISAVTIATEAAAPVIAGLIYDATSTYTTAFAILAAFSLVGLVCALFAHPPKPLASH